jgi:hypothetical protein
MHACTHTHINIDPKLKNVTKEQWEKPCKIKVQEWFLAMRYIIEIYRGNKRLLECVKSMLFKRLLMSPVHNEFKCTNEFIRFCNELCEFWS